MKKGYIHSPIGLLEIVGDEKGICEINFVEEKKEGVTTSNVINQCIEELEEYFQGIRKEFTVPLFIKGTPFQEKTWKELCQVCYGTTATYKEIATRIGNSNASRAVGGANNKNPIPILIPCHRIVGSNNKLVGYAGGLHIKEWLLHHESGQDQENVTK